MSKGLNRLSHYVRWVRRTFFVCCILLLAVCAVNPVHAAISLMPLEEVRVGTHGVARTVVAGTRIEEFGVEILGIMKNKGAVGDLILIRTYGDLIDRSGGVAQGMSGSPVYIGDRLIGAIGYGWSLTDQRTAMVTPIHDMLKILELPLTKAAPPEKEAAPEDPVQSPPEPIKEGVLASPLMAAGFGENALKFLTTKLKPLNLTPYSVGDPPSEIAYGSLEPGSAVGVQLVRGDVSLGALGTVTYVDGDKVLAFGHPFLKRGRTGFLMTNAYIFTTIRGIESSFKVGSTGEVIGTVNQDRGAGVAGQMNQYPGIVPMQMNVRNTEASATKNMEVQIVQDEEIVPILATASMMNGIDKAIDRTGSGTARVTFEISARGMPGENYKRENMFYSPENIAEAAIGEFYEFIAFLASNPHNPVTIMDIKTDISVSPERKTARILSARAIQTEAKPGQTIEVEVKLKPYREEPITRTVNFTVPKDQAGGSLGLTVRGGGFFSMTDLLKKLSAEIEPVKPARKQPKSFEEMMKEFSGRDRNNDIVVEPSGGSEFLDEVAEPGKKPKTKLSETEKAAADKEPGKPEKPEKQEKSKPAASLLNPRKPEQKTKGFLTTDYIVEGDTEITVEVSKTKSK